MRKIKETKKIAESIILGHAAKAGKTAKAAKAARKLVRPRPAATCQTSEEVYVQYGGVEWSVAELTAKARAAYEAQNHGAEAVKTLQLYVKPQEGKAYYVINGGISGSVEL